MEFENALKGLQKQLAEIRSAGMKIMPESGLSEGQKRDVSDILNGTKSVTGLLNSLGQNSSTEDLRNVLSKMKEKEEFFTNKLNALK